MESSNTEGQGSDYRKRNSVGNLINRIQNNGANLPVNGESQQERSDMSDIFDDAQFSGGTGTGSGGDSGGKEEQLESPESGPSRYIPMQDRIKRAGVGRFVVPDKTRNEELKKFASRPVYPEGRHYEGATAVLGGAGSSLAQSRARLIRDSRERSNKLAKMLKEEERKKEIKLEEDRAIAKKKQEARELAEKQKRLETERQMAKSEDVRRQRAGFLDKLEKKA